MRVYHFEVVAVDGTDTYDEVYACIVEKGWRGCLEHAEVWLDEAMPASASAKPSFETPISAVK